VAADPHPAGRGLHRDVRLSETQQAALQLGYKMTTEATRSIRTTPAGTAYADAARDNLWMHFTRQSTYEPKESGGAGASVPIIVKGEGAYIWDDQGRKYLDALSGLFVVQVGHGREEL